HMLWANSLMSVAHPTFMQVFTEWLGKQTGTMLARRGFEPATLYSRAFEYSAARSGLFALAGDQARGTSRDRRMRRSRVTSGAPCTKLVAAMISSAGSLRKSRARLCLHTARSSGQIWRFESAR